MGILSKRSPDTDELDRRLPSTSVGSPEHPLTIAVANGDVEKIVQIVAEMIPTLEDAHVTLLDHVGVLERQATFVRPGVVLGKGTWV